MHITAEDCGARVLETAPLVMRAIRDEMRSHRAPDLSVPQFRALAFLHRHDGASLSDAAESLGLTPPSMSRAMDGLVARNLVRRTTHPSDRRRLALSLTPRGRALHRSARAATQRMLAKRLAALRPADRAVVAQAMAVLRALFADPSETAR